MTPVNEPNLTNPFEFQEVIRGFKVSKAPGPNGFPNRALKHLPQRAVSHLVQIFNAILLTHHFPTVEARSSDLYTYTEEGPSTAVILSTN